MKRLRVVVLALALAWSVSPVGPATAAPAAITPLSVDGLSIAVSGDGVATYPAFAAGTTRYAVTGALARGAAHPVTVTVSGTDPGTGVRVDGRPAPGGVATLTDLAAGEEISVLVGTAAYAFLVTPDGFPTLERTTPDASLAALEPGQTLLTLGLYTAPSPFFETAVDANGVPVWVHERAGASSDLTAQPDGHLSVARTSSTPGAGSDIVELGADLQPIGTYRMIGLPNTDSHDAILLPDGRRFLLGYEPNVVTGLTDAVVQEADAAGHVLFQWSSAPYADETMTAPGTADYAHVNSISLTPDGDLLVSFRHFSSVWRIALTARPGVAVGDVVWRLGGRDSDFTFPDATGDGTDGGPCAQHTATMLPDGHVLVWDNGSATETTAYCVPGSDHAGPAVGRPQTRVAEFALDEAAGTAHLASSYVEPGRYTIFAGSARRLAHGDTLLGWGSEHTSVASEVSPTGTLLWNLRDTATDTATRLISYRAARAVVPDWAPPVVTVDSPAAGLVVDQDAVVDVSSGCTDVGGSTLQTCDTSPAGVLLDTATPGRHAVTTTATDGAGHRTTVRRTYVVRAASRPELAARPAGRSGFDAGPVTARPGGCTAVRLTNAGVRADRLRLRATPPARHWRLTWSTGGRGVTRAVAGPGYLTPPLAPGRSTTLCLRVARTDRRRTTPDVAVGVVGVTGAGDRLRVRLHG